MDTAISTTELPVSRVRWHWLIPVGLALLAILLYWNTQSFELMHSWDDNRYLKENYLLRDFSVQGIVNIFTQVYFAAYIPITIFSYWIEFNIWQLDPAGYHIVNTVLHGLNTALVYLFLLRLLGKRYVALFAAVLFAVHPLQVESVAWVAERKNLLSMFFTLLAFLAHMRSGEENAPRWALPLTWVLYFLAVFAKPVVVGVPILFGMIDYFWAKKSLKESIVRNLIPLVTAIAAALLIVVAHEGGGGIKTYRGGSFFSAQLLMMMVYWEYLVSFIAPFNLDNFYIYPNSVFDERPITMFLGLALVLAVSAYIVVTLVRVFVQKKPLSQPFFLFAAVWVILLLLPTANIVPIAIERADRYMYYPSIVVFAAVGLGLEYIWRRWNTPIVQYAIIGATAIVIGIFSTVTLNRMNVWRNEGALWSDHLIDYPTSQTGWLNLGVYYFNTGNYAEAKPTFESLLRLNPGHFKGNRFMGHIAINENRFPNAITYYERALQAEPNDSITHNYLGLAYYRTDNFEKAVEHYRRAINLSPDAYNPSYTNLGNAALRIGNYELAQQALVQAVNRTPDSAQAHSDLCATLVQLDKIDDAVVYCQRAVELKPDDGLYLGRYAHVLIITEQYAEALPIAQRAVEIAPNLSLSHRVLGEALAGTGDREGAIAAFQRTLEIDSDNTRARDGLNALLNPSGGS